MASHRLTNASLIIIWFVITGAYLLLEFRYVTLIELDSKDLADKWNEVGKDVSMTMSTSLLFWLITEALIKLREKREYKVIQDSLLNELTLGFNREFSFATTRPIGSYVFVTPHLIMSTDARLIELLNEYVLDLSKANSTDPAALKNIGNLPISIIRGFREALKREQASRAPYMALFPPPFYEQLDEMTKRFDDTLTQADRDPGQSDGKHIEALFQYRADLIRLWNIYFKDHGISGEYSVPKG